MAWAAYLDYMYGITLQVNGAPVRRAKCSLKTAKLNGAPCELYLLLVGVGLELLCHHLERPGFDCWHAMDLLQE